jgi:hypothetical protein
MSLDRSTPEARASLIRQGHDATCATGAPRPTLGPCVFLCSGCYAWGQQSEPRPRTMEAAYAALPPKARAIMARHATMEQAAGALRTIVEHERSRR